MIDEIGGLAVTSSELNDQAVLTATKGRLARVGSLEAVKVMEPPLRPVRRVLDKAVLWRRGGPGCPRV